MSEHTDKSPTDPSHASRIEEELRDVLDYGPFKITTRVPDIPGVEYRNSYNPRDDDRRFATIGNRALCIIADESSVNIEVRTGDGTEPFPLSIDEIEHVDIDHPHGEHMPLQGQLMMHVNLTEQDGEAILRWPNHVIEYGWHDRIDTQNHPEYPGIRVVKCYSAHTENIMNTGTEPAINPTLEEAMAADKHPRTFLLTKIDDETYVVTSRIGYKKTRPVTVRKPKHPGGKKPQPLLHVEMLDFAKDTNDEELLKRHIDRYRNLNGKYLDTPRWPMTSFEADGVFLYMVSD